MEQAATVERGEVNEAGGGDVVGGEGALGDVGAERAVRARTENPEGKEAHRTTAAGEEAVGVGQGAVDVAVGVAGVFLEQARTMTAVKGTSIKYPKRPFVKFILSNTPDVFVIAALTLQFYQGR